MNMSGFLLFGVQVEQTYGSAFYLALNFTLALLSNAMTQGYYAFMAYNMPVEYQGGPQNLFNCGVGYSNILFGIAMVFSYVGEPYFNFLGLCRVEKKFMPWLYMLLIYLTIPNSSFLGHFCGLMAGLLIKFGGLYILLPRFLWIQSFEESITSERVTVLERYGYSQGKE